VFLYHTPGTHRCLLPTQASGRIEVINVLLDLKFKKSIWGAFSNVFGISFSFSCCYAATATATATASDTVTGNPSQAAASETVGSIDLLNLNLHCLQMYLFDSKCTHTKIC